MSKFSTRKGLGLAAVLALGASLLSGVAPASAATVLVPTGQSTNDNTKNHVLAGTAFSLTATNGGNDGVFKIKNTGTTTAHIAYKTGSGSIAGGAWAVDNNNGIATADLVANDSIAVDFEYVGAISSQLAVVSVDTGSQLTVTASSDGVTFDGGPVVIDYDGASAVGAAAIAANYNQDNVTATWTFGANVNVDQIAWSLNNTVGFDYLRAGIFRGTGAALAYDFNSAEVVSGALVVTHTYPWNPAELSYSGVLEARDATGAWGQFASSWGYGTAAAVVVTDVSKALGVLGADVNNNNNNYTVVRSGTKSVNITAAATDDEGAGVAGRDALVTISEDGLNVLSTISAGGKTLISGGADISFHVTTDANGNVNFALANSGAKNLDNVDIEVTVEGVSSGWSEVVWEDAEYTLGSPITAPEYDQADKSVVIGSTFPVNYQVRDQWGPANPGADYIVSLSRTDYNSWWSNNRSTSNTQATWATKTAAVAADGSVTFSITDNGQGTGVDKLTATLLKNLVAVGDSVENRIIYNSTAALAATTISATVTAGLGDAADNAQDVTGFSDYRNFNTYFEDALYAQACVNSVVITGAVTGAAGAVPGALVTFSATGAAFYSYGDDETISARNSLSIYSDRHDGSYSITLCSDKPGKNVVTITSGSATKTANVYFLATAAKTVTLAVNGGAATAQTGRSITVSATVKDSNGYVVPNRVVTFSATGLGAFDSATATTGDDGVATVHFLTGAAEAGSVVFTATVKAAALVAGVSKAQADAAASASVTETFIHAAGSITHKGKVATAKWSAAAGQKIVVIVDGYRRYTQVELSDNANAFTKRLKKGKHVINLYIGGVLVDSHKFTIKK